MSKDTAIIEIPKEAKLYLDDKFINLIHLGGELIFKRKRETDEVWLNLEHKWSFKPPYHITKDNGSGLKVVLNLSSYMSLGAINKLNILNFQMGSEIKSSKLKIEWPTGGKWLEDLTYETPKTTGVLIHKAILNYSLDFNSDATINLVDNCINWDSVIDYSQPVSSSFGYIYKIL